MRIAECLGILQFLATYIQRHRSKVFAKRNSNMVQNLYEQVESKFPTHIVED